MSWIDRVKARAAVAVLSEADPREIARVRLVEFYQLVLDAPTHVLNAYTPMPDPTIDKMALPIEERLGKGQFTFNPPTDASEPDLLFALAAQIRALDNYLENGRNSRGPVARPEKRWLVKAEAPAYLIPTTVPRQGSRKGEDDGLGAFTLRALRHHRILPVKIHDYDVVLAEGGLKVGRGGGELQLGAGLFSDLDLAATSYAKGAPFVADRVICATLDEEIGAHLSQAHESRCAILAFPELTIDKVRRKRIVTDLRTKPWSTGEAEEAWRIPLILAGSWHETDESDGQVYNVAPVLNAHGREIVRHRKVFPYVPRKGQVEGIASGKALTILVAEDALIAVGICRDFCERGTLKPNPYSLLDVDLFLVASYGDATTMKGHFATASDAYVRFRAGAFVVQQAPLKLSPILGFVLTPTDHDEVDPQTIAQRGSWVGPKKSTPKG